MAKKHFNVNVGEVQNGFIISNTDYHNGIQEPPYIAKNLEEVSKVLKLMHDKFHAESQQCQKSVCPNARS